MEPVFVVLIVFASVVTIVKMSLDFKRKELMASQGDGSSLRTSELKQLIRDAVDEAMEPVVQRLDQHERQLSTNEPLLLDESSAIEDSEDAVQ